MAAAPKESAKILDLPTEKAAISRLRDKISDKAAKDARFLEKSAIILSDWVNKKKK